MVKFVQNLNLWVPWLKVNHSCIWLCLLDLLWLKMILRMSWILLELLCVEMFSLCLEYEIDVLKNFYSILCLAAMFCLDMDRNFIMRTWNWNACVLKKKMQLKWYNGLNINEEMVGIDMFNLWLYKFDEWVNQCCMNDSYWIEGLAYFSFSFSVCCHCWFAFADLSPI